VVLDGEHTDLLKTAQQSTSEAHRRPRHELHPSGSLSLDASDSTALALLAEAQSNREIAATLRIGASRVKSHLKSTFEKPHVSKY
jgi:DNA-binding CsgD family transcriptional regulator